MKRSGSGTHDLESENIATQKFARDEAVTETGPHVGGGDDKDPPPPANTDSWILTALPVKMVFCTRDIVLKVMAPLLDLGTLFNLSCVNRRLRTILCEEPSLQAAKGYKGTMADYPEFLLEHVSDLRVTQWMARRWKRTYPLVVDFCGGIYTSECDYDHFLKHLVWPLLEKSKLPDEELGHHLALILPIIFPDWFSVNWARQMTAYVRTKESPRMVDRDTLLENIAHAACKRIHDPLMAMTLIEVFVTVIKSKTAADNVKCFWDRALLFAQIAGNARLAAAIVSVHGLLLPAENHPRMMLLFACASGKLDFFEQEYARVGNCVPIPELLLFAKLCEQAGMVRYLIDVHCHIGDLEKIVRFLDRIDLGAAFILMQTAKIAKASLFSYGFDREIRPDQEVFKFERHVIKLTAMLVDAYIRKSGGNPNDSAERSKVQQIFHPIHY